MPQGAVDLDDVARRLARRASTRSEATVQSDVRLFLLAAPLGLEEGDLQEIVLEAPAGERRRIDVEAGFTVIEVKKDLRVGHVRTEAIQQLAGYVKSRVDTLGQRYVGMLTDGAEWFVYHLTPSGMLEEVSSFSMSSASPNSQGLAVWLEGVLATREKIVPTPVEIERRLGSESSAHQLDFAELSSLYEQHRDEPGLEVKRQLWAKLLRTAFGSGFSDDDQLFVEHTLLVITADVIAHSVVGFDPESLSPGTILSGQQFERALITGVVEEDFFDWPLEVEGGEVFLRTLTRRLSRFEWTKAEHDVMKTLYESVIDADQRHNLGEYYTPDWLAERMVAETVHDPLNERVLDPACGSGTFLFYAVRLFLDAAEKAGWSNDEALGKLTNHVIGVDLHPLAIIFARVTYLLAIGLDRIKSKHGPVNIPVYLGDGLQWGQTESLFTAGTLSVSTSDDSQLFGSDLRFPENLLEDAGRFDGLIAELADKATNRVAGTPAPSLAAVFRRFAVPQSSQAVVTESFRLMCALHDNGRNHIWGYFVRNLARPVWLAREPNRVSVLIGNPPWLRYSAMTASMQQGFRTMSQERGLWAGGTMAPHQDLSALFLVRSVELYLRDRGRFAFVMPRATLSRRQFEGFRRGFYPGPGAEVALEFETPWDLDGVRPHPFPVPSSVVFGTRTRGTGKSLPSESMEWSGTLPTRNAAWSEAATKLNTAVSHVRVPGDAASDYAERFSQGATVVPRMLLLVEKAPPGPLGAGAGRRAVRSLRSRQEKRPWRDLPSLEGVVETEFIRPVHLGSTTAPYRLLEPVLGVIPWDGKRLLDGAHSSIDLYPGLAEWWRRAEAVWLAHRSSDRLSLLERLDFRRGASLQFPLASERVVYTKAGTRLAAARLTDPSAFVDHKLYWAAAASREEALYLTAILNSEVLRKRVAPLQARGQFGARDFDKYVFQVAIPTYSATTTTHTELVNLAARAESLAVEAPVTPGTGFQAARRAIRGTLSDEGVARQIEDAVEQIVPITA